MPSPSGPGTTSKAGCPSTFAGTQLNPAAPGPPIAKNRLFRIAGQRNCADAIHRRMLDRVTAEIAR